jgi:signal transduction histidine kinase
MTTRFDVQQLGQVILQQLSTTQEPEQQLDQIAQVLGQQLTAQACLLLPPHDRQAGLEGYWCDGAIAVPDAAYPQLRQLNPNVQRPFATIQELPLSAGGVVRFAHQDPAWQLPLPADQQGTLFNMVAIALSHLQLQTQLHWQHNIHELFEQLCEAIRKTDDVDDLFQVTLSELGQFLKIDRSFVMLLKYKNPLAREPFRQATGNIVSRWQLNQTIPAIAAVESCSLPDDPICLEAWHNAPHASVFFHRDRTPMPSSTDRFLDWDAFPTLLLLPLLGSSQGNENKRLVLGFIGFQQTQRHHWTSSDLAMLRWVSTQVSTSIIHHNTLKQVKILVDKRTAQLKGSLEVQARLYEKTRQQVEQLRQLIELKDEFLDSVSHELRTPLTSMKVAIQILRQPQLTPERKGRYLDLLEQEWQREYDLIQNLLKLQQSESQSLLISLQDLDMVEFLKPLVEAFEQRWTSKKLTVDVSVSTTPFIVCSHPEGLERVINELLTNAGKYSAANTTVEIEMGFDHDQIMIAVSSYGAGISEADQERIFDKFMRGQGVTQQGIAGTGLGLALVKSLVKHLSGEITVQSQLATDEALGKTCFTLALPITPATHTLNSPDSPASR